MKKLISGINDLAWKKIRGTFITLKYSSAGCLINPTLNPHEDAFLISAPLELPLAECHTNGTSAFPSWLLSRCVTYSDSVCGAVWLWSVPLFCHMPFAQTDHHSLGHLPAEGHLRCSSFGAVRNKATLNVHGHLGRLGTLREGSFLFLVGVSRGAECLVANPY